MLFIFYAYIKFSSNCFQKLLEVRVQILNQQFSSVSFFKVILPDVRKELVKSFNAQIDEAINGACHLILKSATQLSNVSDVLLLGATVVLTLSPLVVDLAIQCFLERLFKHLKKLEF